MTDSELSSIDHERGTPKARRRRRSSGSGQRRGAGAGGGRRHQGRILALQVLYEVDVSGHSLDEVLHHTFVDQAVPPAIRTHVERLTTGVKADQSSIDPWIADAAPAFPVAQLAAVDRNVLRLAIYELTKEPAVPPKAAINEAVELAKQFGGEHSGRFINGVLGTVIARLDAQPDNGAIGPESTSDLTVDGTDR